MLAAPPMTGAEYHTAPVLGAFWQEQDTAFRVELSESKCRVEELLKRRNPAWNLVGRVHFNLAENRKDEAAPFAFRHLHDAAGGARQSAASSPGPGSARICRGPQTRSACSRCFFPCSGRPKLSLAEGHGRLGRTFPPLRWMPDQAMQLLRDVPQLESAGVVVRMPAMWRANRPPQRASDSHRRWQAAIGTGANCASRFPLGSNPRWRKTHRGRDQRIARQAQRACFDSRALGSGRSAAAE